MKYKSQRGLYIKSKSSKSANGLLFPTVYKIRLGGRSLSQEAGVLGSFSESANTWAFDIGLENSLNLIFPSVKKGKIISCLCTS